MSENRSNDCRLVPENFCRPPSFVSDYEAFFPTSLDLKYLHYGTVARLDIPENVLIDFEGIFRCLFEEDGI